MRNGVTNQAFRPVEDGVCLQTAQYPGETEHPRICEVKNGLDMIRSRGKTSVLVLFQGEGKVMNPKLQNKKPRERAPRTGLKGNELRAKALGLLSESGENGGEGGREALPSRQGSGYDGIYNFERGRRRQAMC